MSCSIHDHGSHTHSPNCGHKAILHGDHLDYLHDGHLHFVTNGKVEDHALEVSTRNPDRCTSGHACSGHDADHVHGENCGHAAIPHGDHVCYLVDGHLHHPHNGHCDHHGTVAIA